MWSREFSRAHMEAQDVHDTNDLSVVAPSDVRITGGVVNPAGQLVGGAGPVHATSATAEHHRGLSYLLQMGAEICDESGDSRATVALLLETYSRNSAGKHECLELLVRYGIALPDTPPMAVHRGRIDLLEAHLAHDPALLTRTFSHQDIYPPALGCHDDESLAFHGTPLAGGTIDAYGDRLR